MNRVTAYDALPIAFTHGKGAWVFDEEGKAYLDALSGIAVCGLGHAHPEVTNTIAMQAAKISHISNGYIIPEQVALAEKLARISGMEQMFFANSGAEANETAIKLTRLYGHKKGIETPTIIVMEKSFHGRTMATLTASGSRKTREGFEPFVPGFVRAPFNDIEAIKTIAANRSDVVAVMFEPILGEGGVHVADDAYLREVADLCDRNGWLLILDEIQTGNGRTGQFFAYMHSDIKPDIVTTAKGLGNGIPISVCLMQKKALNLLKPGNHGSTFGGNPLCCAVALTVLNIIERDKLCERAMQKGLVLKNKLIDKLSNNPMVRAIRGKGLMLGIELDRPAQRVRALGIENGILFNVTSDSVIRILPPLIINDEEIDELVERVALSIEQFGLN
jgi:acetylornithine/N-succinyldiaminopimelate aminotransferase